jgi:MATE family multidrug resistance protein
LAASALATMYCNVTGFSIGIGMASALDTLCSQAFTGSPDKQDLGRHLQRSIFIMFIICIPVALVWIFSESIFLFLGQDATVSRIAGEFTLYMLIGLMPYCVTECLKKYLQGQGIMKAHLVVTLVATPINIFLQYLLVWSPYQIGVKGAPIATSVTYTIILGLMILYIRFVEGYEAWGGWELKQVFDFKQIYTFLKLGIPGMFQICSEWWAFEVVALLAGLLGTDMLAAQTIVLNTASLFYMLPLGLSIASSTRVGNCLGANETSKAKNASSVAVRLGLAVGLFNFVVLICIKDYWGWVWTKDAKVVSIVSEILPLAAVFQFSDSFGAVGGGILRGSGRQRSGALINLAGYYILGLPIGVVLAFSFNHGLKGLWEGLTVSLFIVSIILYILLYFTDWEVEAVKARSRISSV